MQFDVSSQGGQQGILTIKISEADYKEEVNSSLKKFQQARQFPGFRKGKAPMGLVAKQVGTELKREEINKIINKNLSDYIQENREKIIFYPVMKDVENLDWDKVSDFTFDFSIAFRPEFDLPLASLESLEMKVLKITDSDIDAEILNLRKQHAHPITLEKIEDRDDLVFVFRLTELNDDGSVLEGGYQKTIRVEYEDFSDKMKSIFIGKGDKEQFEIDLKSSFTTEELVSLLGAEKQTVEDLSNSFRVEIQGAVAFPLHPLNEEFYTHIFHEEEKIDEQQFRERITEGLSRHYRDQNIAILLPQVKERLTEGVSMQLPMEFLELWYTKNSDTSKLEDSELQSRIEKFAEATKWDLITEKLAREYAISVDDEQVKYGIQSYIYQQYGQQIQYLGEERLNQMVDNLFAQENFRENLRQSILENKVTQRLMDKINFAQIELSRSEFDIFVKSNQNQHEYQD